MSIDRTQKTQPVTLGTTQQDVRLAGRNQSNNGRPAAEQDGTKVKLSTMMQEIKSDSSEDIDMARINRIKEAIKSGELKMDYDKIAQALLEEIFQDY